MCGELGEKAWLIVTLQLGKLHSKAFCSWILPGLLLTPRALEPIKSVKQTKDCDFTSGLKHQISCFVDFINEEREQGTPKHDISFPIDVDSHFFALKQNVQNMLRST